MRIISSCLSALAAALSAASLSASEKPVVYFDFNGPAADMAVADKSGNHHDSKLSNGAAPCDGVDGLGARFTNRRGHVNIDLAGKWEKPEAVTVSCWAAPEELKHQVLVHSAPLGVSVDDASLSLRLRENWQIWFGVTTVDGERRGAVTGKPCFSRIAYPENREWLHLVGVYDGETVSLYVNGECVANKKHTGVKPFKPLTAPVRIGGIGNETYHGTVDEFRLFDSALAPEEIKSLYEARSAFKPLRIESKSARTIDGLPYSGCGQYNAWMTVPLGGNRLFISNIGEVLPFGCSTVCAQNQWVPIQPVSIMGLTNAKDKLFREVKGNIELRVDGSTLITLDGELEIGLGVKQTVEVTKERDVKFSYVFSSKKPGAQEPYVSFPIHLWPSAMRFVGSDDRGLITGNLMDLDGEIKFKDILEINLVSSDNRLGFDFGSDARYQVSGTRSAEAWANGYTTFPGKIVATGEANKWGSDGRLDIAFTLRLEEDTRPPRLDRSKALEATKDHPFDFSGLYERDATRLGIHPADRDTPIYMDDESVRLDLNIPAKTLPASKRASKWFHLAGVYDGHRSQLYLNGKPFGGRLFADDKPVRLAGDGRICIGGPQEPFKGVIDNVRLYRRALAPEELLAHFNESADFKPGAAADQVGGKLKPEDPSLALWLDFDKLEDGCFVDRSPLGLKAISMKAALGDGVDGSGVRLENGASVSVTMPESAREFKALTIEAWISPDVPQHSTILCGVHQENKHDAHPLMLRWRQGNEFWFNIITPDGQGRPCNSAPAAATIFFPVRHTWSLTNCHTKAASGNGEFTQDAQGRVDGKLELRPLPAAVYELKVEALGADGKALDQCATELAVAGVIPQAKAKAGEGLNLKKIDEADLTLDDPGHDFFSCSGRSRVVKGEKGVYRQTLTLPEYIQQIDKDGTGGRANDWFGVRFRTEPGKIYVFDIEYPDLPLMSMSEYLIEPKDDPADGKCKPCPKTMSGVFTGSFLPHDNGMKTHSLTHFASAPWVAVCLQNAHHFGRPDAATPLDPASCARITMSEVVGDLPALDAPVNRQVGVHTEDGGLSLGSFGLEKFRGELANWLDRPKTGEYYRHAYIAVSNLIKYMRYRGDTTLFFGVYRYRAAQFPSRLFPPSNHDVDLPMLMARMFERNGLRLVLNVQANNPLPESRLHESTHYDVWSGKGGVSNVNASGRQNAGGSAIFPISSPWHPKVRAEYCRLAAELGGRYGKYPAVAGISWITGQCWWSPTLAMPFDDKMSAEQAEDALLGLTSDDETIRQFEAWSGVKIPAEPPRADQPSPARFKERHEWIMKNAKDKFISFRDWAMAQTHLAFQKAFAEKAPGKDYIAIDFYYHVFHGAAEWPSALDAVRMIGFGPEQLKGAPREFLYGAYMPEANGCTYWEHANYKWEWMPRLKSFLADDKYAEALSAAGRTARYIHRQFYEQAITMPNAKGRDWMWSPDAKRLAVCSYPQQGSRGYLADFVNQLARGNPDYICYSWCDSLIPMGHEPRHREMAAAFRSIPPGPYSEACRKDGVFVRLAADKKAFYVVNTNGAPVRLELGTGAADGDWRGSATGETKRLSNGGSAEFSMKPFDCQVFLPAK